MFFYYIIFAKEELIPNEKIAEDHVLSTKKEILRHLLRQIIEFWRIENSPIFLVDATLIAYHRKEANTMTYADQEKTVIFTQCRQGKPIHELCTEYGVCAQTIYRLLPSGSG